MNTLEASIRCISMAFVIAFLAATGPNLGSDIWPLAGLMAFVAAVLLIFEFSNLEPVTAEVAVQTRPMPHTSGRWGRGLDGE